MNQVFALVDCNAFYCACERLFRPDLLGIPVSIGIGPTKVLAKAANAYAKKQDSGKGVVCVMNHRQQDQVLAQLDIEEVWGIGRRIAQASGSSTSIPQRISGISTTKA